MNLRPLMVVFVLSASTAFATGPMVGQDRKDTGERPGVKNHMKRAHEAFVAGEYKTAAQEIRQIAEIENERAQKLPASENKALRKAAKDLSNFSDNVEAGKIKSVDKIDEALNGTEVLLNR